MRDIQKSQEIDGWMSLIELGWLAENAAKSSVIIEIGCYKGRSTRALADNCPGVVYAIDPWNGNFYKNDGTVEYTVDAKIYNEFRLNMNGHLESGRVIPVKKKLEDAISDIREADLIFIDADHRYESVLHDILLASQLLKRGGILSGHDYGQGSWPGVKKAVDKAFQKVNVTDTIWWLNL